MTKDELIEIIRSVCIKNGIRASAENQEKIADAIAKALRQRQQKSGIKAYSMGPDGLPIEL